MHLEDNARIPIVFNRVQPILQSVVGLEITNRTEVSFVPREIGDIKANEVLTQAAQWFRDQANAEEAESEAFRDLLICGVGFTETSLDFEGDPEGQPKIERIDPIEMGWECAISQAWPVRCPAHLPRPHDVTGSRRRAMAGR